LKTKINIAFRDAAAKTRLLRIVDESGEDYLYPKKSFRPIALPLGVKRAVLALGAAATLQSILEHDSMARTIRKARREASSAGGNQGRIQLETKTHRHQNEKSTTLRQRH